LYRSITEVLFALPDETVVLPAHDYRGVGQSTIGEEKAHNPRVAGKSVDEFVVLMNGLDLPRPAKIDVAVPSNRACGELPQA
jgi:glyoxylase-like metal-dependent hydrolase (beta-lactamase superfamily II)